MITVHGLMGEPSAALVRDAASAAWVVGGRRHLDALGIDAERRIVLGSLTDAIERLSALDPSVPVVVVASGDPGYFGVVRALRAAGLRPRVVPAPSSIAMAFAAVGVPWDDAAVVSVHGRPLEPALALARGCGKVGVLTSRGHGLRELAAGLEGFDRTYVLAERLGEPDERVRVLSAAEAVETEPVEPHVVLILERHPDDPDAPWNGQLAGGEPAIPAGLDESGDGLVIGQVVSGAASLAHADAIEQAIGPTRRYDTGAVTGLPRAWGECDLIISHLALGATARILAPLLHDKHTDPGVVVVDEAGRFAIPLVGGHVGGANALARRVSEALGGTAVLTTATDALSVPGLDTLGWPCTGDVAGVTRAILDGRPVAVVRELTVPLPPLPPNVTADAVDPVARIVVTDRVQESAALPTVVLTPPSLVVGMGCNAGTSVDHLRDLLHDTLAMHGLDEASVCALTSVDAKAHEPGLVALASELGLPLTTYPPERLNRIAVPHPSDAPRRAVGTPSVAEASVVANGADLVVTKTKTREATIAIGRRPARGHLSIVGIGPGSLDLLTPRARETLRSASVVVGYRPYINLIKPVLRPGTRIVTSAMGREEDRIQAALDEARAGNAVALVSSGDAGMYAMASPTLELGTTGIDVEIIPGVTASLASAALVGAPLGHDSASISLSDLHTDWETIVRRLEAAAEGDFVVTLYNPRSRKRLHHLPDALEILGRHRPPTTPVAIVEDADRPSQRVILTTLAEVDVEQVTMNCLVIVGSSTTRYVPGTDGSFMVTPRDYHWMTR